jgi:hypothetical protein
MRALEVVPVRLLMLRTFGHRHRISRHLGGFASNPLVGHAPVRARSRAPADSRGYLLPWPPTSRFRPGEESSGRRQYVLLRRFIDQYSEWFREPTLIGTVAQALQSRLDL